MKPLLILSCLIALQAQAQKLDSLNKNTHLFVKMGAIQNNLYQNDLFNQSLTGLEMGASLQTKLKPNLYSEIGLSYIRKGGAREVIYYNSVNEKILSYTENVYLHYVQLPVVLNYNHHFSGPTHLLIGAGAYGGYLFSAWINPQHYYLNHEQKPQYNNWDMGGILSTTICYKKWALYGQYQTGILNISNNTGGLNNTWVFGLAYRLK